MVLMLEGQGDHTRVQINFAEAGTKWILPAYANLEKI
jgi:DNA helicase-2/ATP-dependent DNA helicase PcrA